MKPHKPVNLVNKAAIGAHGPTIMPKGPYWQNPVYQFMARTQRNAQTMGNTAEMQRASAIMQEIVENRISAEKYAELEALRIESERRAKSERKKQASANFNPNAARKEESIQTGVNVAEVKRRLFNLQTSPQNMIRELEKLPAAQRKEIAASLTVFLRSKIAPYLKQHNL